ncbi:MAG: acyltransferase [Actinomycetota bacterium]|nr:acyltransferase [Actinomycetota bacterium]
MVNSALESPVEVSRRASGSARPAPRVDIQALRALAVGLVLAYHFRPDWVPGGYIGVDVFFVISGYLITSHLVREARSKGRVSLASFWAARARRILPAALVTIAATVTVSLAILPPTAREQLTREALASIFYVQNWQLAADSVDYLATENVASPFQHFWTLAVEEQFYLAWPLVVALALVVSGLRRRRAVDDAPGGADDGVRRLTRALALLFGAVCLASFVWGAVAVSSHDPSAYFATTTRVWELGAGGLLSIVVARRSPVVVRSALVVLGLGAIVVAAFRLTEQSPFPGVAALAPVLGAAAVIAAGAPVRAADGELEEAGPLPGWTPVAATPVAQWVGDRSYSIYLWHFPVVVLFLAVAGRPRAVEVLALAAATAACAAASYRWVEQPPRRSPFLLARPGRTLALAGAAMLATTLVVLASDRVGSSTVAEHDELAESVTDEPHGGMLDPLLDEPSASTRPAPSATEEATSAPPSEPAESAPAVEVVVGLQEEKPDGTIQALLPDEPLIPTFWEDEAAIAPPPTEARYDQDLILPEDECNAERDSPVTPACDRGDVASETSIVLVGDSHARMFAPPLVRLAEEHGWHLRTYLHNSCPFSPTPREREVEGETICTEPNAVVLDEILELEPDVVVTSWFASSPFIAPDEDVPGAQGLAQYWNELEETGADVVVLRDVPNARRDVVDCVVENYEEPDACAEPPSFALAGVELIEAAFDLAPEVDLVDLTPLHCTKEQCRYVIGGILTHRNRDHVTETWALSVKDHLGEALVEVLARRD